MEIGDRVRPRSTMMVGAHTIESTDRGFITSEGAGTNWEVTWSNTGNHGRLITVIREEDLMYAPPVPPEPEEAPPAMGWFAALAEQNIVYTDELTTTPEKDRHVEIAQVYAILELAAAIDRSRK